MNKEENKQALEAMGIDIKECRACSAPIVWMKTKNGNQMPVTMELKPHFYDCPKAAQFRKAK